MNNHQLQQGKQARIKQTGQLVEIKHISEYGISVVEFRTGGTYCLLNDRLEPVRDLQPANDPH